MLRKAMKETGEAFGRLGNALLDLPFIGLRAVAIGGLCTAVVCGLLFVPVLLARVGYFLYSAIWHRTVCELNELTFTYFLINFPCEIDTPLDGLDLIFHYIMNEMDMSMLMFIITVAGILTGVVFGWLSFFRDLDV